MELKPPKVFHQSDSSLSCRLERFFVVVFFKAKGRRVVDLKHVRTKFTGFITWMWANKSFK